MRVGRRPDPRVIDARMTKARVIGVCLLGLSVSGFFWLAHATQAMVPANAGSIGQLDLWIAQLFLAMRNTRLVQFFSFVTAFGYWGVVFLLAASASAIMGLYRRTRYVPGLWLGLIDNQTTVFILKTLLDRPRPEFSFYRENSAAFPSGHSAASVMVFGFLSYVLIRERIGSRTVSAAMGLLIIVMVGLSRLYLLEHYLSEVLSGYLVGAAWLVLAICVSEWRRAKGERSDTRDIWPWRRFTLFAVIAVTGIAVWLVSASYQRGLQVADPALPGYSSISRPIQPSIAP